MQDAWSELDVRLRTVESQLFRQLQEVHLGAELHGYSHGRGRADEIPRELIDPTPIMVSVQSRLSLGTELAANAAAVVSSAAWPAANRAIYVPFILPEAVTALKMFVEVTTQSGNMDVGIYNVSYARLVSMGSTAVAAAGLQEFDITDTVMGPGQFYWGMCVDNTTAAFMVHTGSGAAANRLKGWGVAQEAVGAVTLPATATPAVVATGYLPWIGMSLRTLVA